MYKKYFKNRINGVKDILLSVIYFIDFNDILKTWFRHLNKFIWHFLWRFLFFLKQLYSFLKVFLSILFYVNKKIFFLKSEKIRIKINFKS